MFVRSECGLLATLVVLVVLVVTTAGTPAVDAQTPQNADALQRKQFADEIRLQRQLWSTVHETVAKQTATVGALESECTGIGARLERLRVAWRERVPAGQAREVTTKNVEAVAALLKRVDAVVAERVAHASELRTLGQTLERVCGTDPGKVFPARPDKLNTKERSSVRKRLRPVRRQLRHARSNHTRKPAHHSPGTMAKTP